jgi:GNAT superfamily N-acetyltransferase
VATPPISVQQAPLAAILELRHAVLRPGRPLETARFDGDLDADTIHLAAVRQGSGEVVGCATLLPRPWNDRAAWQLRGMATRADLVRRGIGAAMLRAAERIARDRGAALLWCNARLGAVPFYASGGWRVVSEEFDVEGIGPHHVMVRELEAG